MKIYWGNLWAMVGVIVLGAALGLDEVLGIVHWSGMIPITDQAEIGLRDGNPTLFLLMLAVGPVYVAWWIFHIRNHRYR